MFNTVWSRVFLANVCRKGELFCHIYPSSQLMVRREHWAAYRTISCITIRNMSKSAHMGTYTSRGMTNDKILCIQGRARGLSFEGLTHLEHVDHAFTHHLSTVNAVTQYSATNVRTYVTECICACPCQIQPRGGWEYVHSRGVARGGPGGGQSPPPGIWKIS